MCGVDAINCATRSAGTTDSSNSTFAFLLFQSTLIERMPFSLPSDDSTVRVQGGQCRPVIKYVAVVVVALESGLAGSAANADATKASDAKPAAVSSLTIGNPHI